MKDEELGDLRVKKINANTLKGEAKKRDIQTACVKQIYVAKQLSMAISEELSFE